MTLYLLAFVALLALALLVLTTPTGDCVQGDINVCDTLHREETGER